MHDWTCRLNNDLPHFSRSLVKVTDVVAGGEMCSSHRKAKETSRLPEMTERPLRIQTNCRVGALLVWKKQTSLGCIDDSVAFCGNVDVFMCRPSSVTKGTRGASRSARIDVEGQGDKLYNGSLIILSFGCDQLACWRNLTPSAIAAIMSTCCYTCNLNGKSGRMREKVIVDMNTAAMGRSSRRICPTEIEKAINICLAHRWTFCQSRFCSQTLFICIITFDLN